MNDSFEAGPSDAPPGSPDGPGDDSVRESSSRALRLARHYADTGQIPRALAETRRALEEDPECAESHLFLAFLYLELERSEEALEEAEGLLARDPEFSGASIARGLALAQLGRNREAEAAHLDALRLDPENPTFLRLYARLLFSVDEYAKAEALARASLERDPTDEDTHALLGLIQMQRGRGAEARASGETAILHAPAEAVGHLAHAAASFRTGRVWRARRHCREALRLDPTNDGAQELYDTIDLHSRIPSLPYYFWAITIQRLPGQAFAVWGIFVLLLYGLPELGVPKQTVSTCALVYIVFCIYTWVALPITRGWRRLLPMRL